MKFSRWLTERNQRAATKMPERKSSLELQQRAAAKNIHGMQHGRAGSIESDKKKGSRGRGNRDAINRSIRGE
jgi:hypothetical protein